MTDSTARHADDQPVDDDSNGGVSVGSRVRIHPDTDTESRGSVVDDFGENAGAAVNVGNRVTVKTATAGSFRAGPRR